MKAVNILWDTDNVKDLEFLPKEVNLPDVLGNIDEISEHLSNLTGFCHLGFEITE